MKLALIALSAIVASTAAHEGVDLKRLRSRALESDDKVEEPSFPEPVTEETMPLYHVSSMSMNPSMSIHAVDEWDAELDHFGFGSFISLSMSTEDPDAVKCDKKCKKEQIKAEETAHAQFGEWGAQALTPFAFDVAMSFSMSMSESEFQPEPVKCDKRCQKDKLKNNQRRRLSKSSGLRNMQRK